MVTDAVNCAQAPECTRESAWILCTHQITLHKGLECSWRALEPTGHILGDCYICHPDPINEGPTPLSQTQGRAKKESTFWPGFRLLQPSVLHELKGKGDIQDLARQTWWICHCIRPAPWDPCTLGPQHPRTSPWEA